MEHKFIQGSASHNNETGELTLTWHDGAKLIFPNEISYYNWEWFMIRSNFQRTREELLEMTELMDKTIGKYVTNGQLDTTFSFEEHRERIHQEFK